jgi:hypothetical protein
MRSDAAKTEPGAVVRERGVQVDAVGIARVPGQHDVHVAKEARVDHIDLASASLLGGRSVIVNSALQAACLQLFLDCNRR